MPMRELAVRRCLLATEYQFVDEFEGFVLISIISQFETKSKYFFNTLVSLTRTVFPPKAKALGFQTVKLDDTKSVHNFQA